MTLPRPRHSRCSARAVLVVTSILLGALAAATPALAEAGAIPHWTLESRAAPTNLPLNGEGLIIVTASNTGDAEAPGTVEEKEAKKIYHTKITDTLPAGIEATHINVRSKGTPRSTENVERKVGEHVELFYKCSAPPVTSIVCEFEKSLPVYEQFELLITVTTHLGAAATLENNATVEDGPEKDGGARPAELTPSTRYLRVSNEPVHFGVESFEMMPENGEFKPDTEAGSHPFQLTTTFNLDEGIGVGQNGKELVPAAPVVTLPDGENVMTLEKNLSFKLPPGLIGDANVVRNPNAVQQCPDGSFGVLEEGGVNFCPENTALGVAAVTFTDPITLGYDTYVVPVFNLVPAPGEPARFGFEINKVPIILETSVRTGEDYGVTVSVHNASEAVQVLSSRVTFWGVPLDERHNEARGWECLGKESWLKLSQHPIPCQPTGVADPTPFLMLPTACGAPDTTVSGEAWNEDKFSGVEYASPALQKCEALPFNPSIKVKPGSSAASTPTGLSVNVNMPQKSTLQAGGKEEADIEKTTLELPVGMQANPGAAGGLNTCAAAGKIKIVKNEQGELEEAFTLGEEAIGFNPAPAALHGGVQLRSQHLAENEPGRTLLKELELDNAIQAENDHFTSGMATCPESAKIGTVNIRTPLLENELTGAVYLAEQDTNPFESPLVVYIVAEEPKSGVLVKLAGETSINPGTGQLISVFKHTPQTAFESLELQLFNSPRPTQTTPAQCGPKTAKAAFYKWLHQSPEEDESELPYESKPTESEPESTESTFQITSGPNGMSCPSGSLPFEPSFEPETNKEAGHYSAFKLKIKRPDGDAALKTISMQLPPGFAAKLASVTPCGEPQAADGTCGPESKIGESIARSGLGSSPYDLRGQVYLTGPYDGAPFGLSAVTEANAGPFHVGKIVVRSTINVNKFTTAATIDTEAAQFFPDSPTKGEQTAFSGLPEMLKGVPAQIKELEIDVNKPEFEFNPTNCESKSIAAVLTGYEGTSKSMSPSLPVENCGALPFAPKLTAAVKAQGSKENGTEFRVTLESSGLGQANIHKVDLTIPAVLPSRLTTIQKACLAATFEANPASCDEGSVIGEGVVSTPVFKDPLRGKAYLVSHGSAEFPDVEFVLKGEGEATGIEVILDGKTDIKNGITYSKFETSPDAPFTKFESIFPEGPHSALGTNVPEDEHYNLCKQTITMPTEITAQNGAHISETTPVTIVGCGGVKAVTVHHPSKAELLAKALKSCRTKYKHKKAKRLACEKAARKKYAPAAKKSSKAHAKKSSTAHAKKSSYTRTKRT